MAKKIKVSNIKEFNNIAMLIGQINENSASNISFENGEIISSGQSFVALKQEEDYTINSANNYDDNKFVRFDNFVKKSSNHEQEYTWNMVVEEVLDIFYKQNSYLIYAPLEKDTTESDIINIQNFARKFLPNYAGRIVVESSNDNYVENIYEVAVKFRFTYRGEPKYVINKFYFTKNMQLCDAKRCSQLYDSINKHLNENSNEENTIVENGLKIDQLVDINEKIIDAMQNQQGFQDFLVGEAKVCFEEYKKEAIENQIDKVAITCDRIKLRYIANVKLKNQTYRLKDKITGKVLYHAYLSLSNAITLICATCDEVFVDNNIVKIQKNEEFQQYDINLLNLQQIRDCDALNHHVFANTICPKCEQLFCPTALAKCCECEKLICTNCNGDEVKSYINENHEREYYHKSCSRFCLDTLTFIKKSNTLTCDVCGQTYSLNYFEESLHQCNLCAPIVNECEDIQEYKQLYKMHKQFLPLLARSRSNLCNENLSAIIFKAKKGQIYLLQKNGEIKNKSLILKKLT